MPPLDANELEELFEKGGDNTEIVSRWYEELSTYDPEDIEIPETVKRIMKAMKWIMQYEHANAEEFKELAVKEAAETAEKQEIWEEEKENMNVELKSLRERLTAKSNATDLSEAFRVRINSLTEENISRELAEKDERTQKLSFRVEQLENERTKLIQQQVFLDDSIRELSRRLENKMEGSATSEVEAMKLRQRNHQAALLSKQLQEVAQQNEELRAEIEQLSTALASATTFIEETANNYQALYQQLLDSDKIIERLTNDNELLSKKVKLEDEKVIAEKSENIGENSIQHYKDLLHRKDEQIETLQLKFETLQVELKELQGQSVFEDNGEREREMEKLRTELLDATKAARQLFGVTVKNDKVDASIARMQSKITTLNETVDELRAEIKQHEAENGELVRNLEMKDAENQKVIAELKRLREKIFGNAEDEISRLEKQLNFREQQIEKLTAKCSLLQIELSSAFDASDQKLVGSVPAMGSVTKSLIPERDKTDDRGGIETEKSADDANFLREMKKSDVERKAFSGEILKAQKRPLLRKDLGRKKKEYDGDLENLEASAMIISSLNHELMLLMQELDEKDRQLQCMERSVQRAMSSIDELKVNYFNLQKKVSENDPTQYNKIIDELRRKIECSEMEIEEYQKLANSVRLNGSEMQQKIEEMNRQVVAERLRNLQLTRKLEIVERNRNTQNAEYRKVERNYQEQHLLHIRQLKIANYESDLASIEIARLQTLLLHSVPRKDYDKLLSQHKKLLAFDNNYKSTNDFKTDEMDNEYIVVNLLEMSDETKNTEVTVENAHLKEMINVLRSQNKYWQSEVEKIREQNTEMMHFLEDVESESQMKSLLRMRSNSMELITVQQMLQYKEKFIEINANYAESQKYKEEMQRKDEQIQNLEERVQNLQREIEDLFVATFKISDFGDENERIYEAVNPPQTTDELFSNIEKREAKMELRSDLCDEKANLEVEESGKGETPTETIDSEFDAKYHAAAELHAASATQSTKIEHIQSEEYTKKLNYIRETAKLCIANYKEQLKYKDEVIEKYKSLLRVMSDEREEQQTIIDGSSQIVDESARQKLRTSSEILSQNYNTDIEAKDMEIVKLRNEIEQFNKANRRLTKDLQHFHSQTKDCTESGTQTDLHVTTDDEKDDITEEIISNKEGNLPQNTTEESRKSISSYEPSIVTRRRTPSSIQSTKYIAPTEMTEMQNNDMIMETLRREESKMMIMRKEIRDLKQRNAALHVKNQEMEKACESIRAEALSEIKQSYTSNINVESETIVMRLQQELTDLKLEAEDQKKLIREQKGIIDRLQKNQSIKNAQEEISKWHEKKARENNIAVLRKKLKETEQRGHEMCERLKKRDEQIKHIHKLESNRSAELKRLHEIIRGLKNDKEMSNLQMKIVNDHLKTAEKTNSYLNQKIDQMKKASNELLSCAINEKEKASKDTKIADDNIKVNKIVVQNIFDEELRELREKAEKYDDLMEQLIKLETEVKKQRDEIRSLNDKLNERKYDCGAVAVLRDKLMAKEKVIEQQLLLQVSFVLKQAQLWYELK
uniref:Nucleoprotein TPR n=1 Tax=Elaeophora elaphi TaxID=1147741 RepID=A0A158Q734_9BILA